MAGFRVTIPLSKDLYEQQQQRRAPQQQAQNMQLSLTGADNKTDPNNPMVTEASPPPQYQPNSAGADPAMNMNMTVTGSELVTKKRGRGRPRKYAPVRGETSVALVPAAPSLTVSHPGGTGGETSVALVPAAPSLTVSHPGGSGGETSLSLVPGGPSFTVSHPRGSGGETSLSLVPGVPSLTVRHPRGSGGETSLLLVPAAPSFTVSHPRGSGRETSLSLVPGGPSFTVSHPRGSGGVTSLSLVPGGPFTVSRPSGRGGRVKKMRGRGPPSSSANNDKLQASAGSTGVGDGFRPHILTIIPGEDVAAKIMGLNMNGPRSVCVLSAFGRLSNVILHHPTTSGGTVVAYEGVYEILSLSGSFTPVEIDGYKTMTGGLTVTLSKMDNAVFGGSVVGRLVAATPVQVVLGSFIQEKHNEIEQHMRMEQMECYTPTHEEPSLRVMAPHSPQFRGAESESSSGGEEYESPWVYP